MSLSGFQTRSPSFAMTPWENSDATPRPAPTQGPPPVSNPMVTNLLPDMPKGNYPGGLPGGIAANVESLPAATTNAAPGVTNTPPTSPAASPANTGFLNPAFLYERFFAPMSNEDFLAKRPTTPGVANQDFNQAWLTEALRRGLLQRR